jgi:hypothetical protein
MISYRTGNDLDLDTVIELYVASTLGARRPVDDRERMAAMLANANLTVTAWDGDLLVGIARALSDGPQAKLLLLAAPAAEKYYPHVGFTHHPQAWILDPDQTIL